MTTTRFKRVNVEITNQCNLRCDFCAPTSRPLRTMSVAEFRGLAVQLAPMTEEIVPHLLGEPLLHPEFGEILDESRSAGIPVNVVTNGTLLDETRQRWLLHPIVRQVSCSLPSIASCFPPDGALEHLDRILAFCERAAAERPDLYINLRFWDLGADGVPTSDGTLPLRRMISDHFGLELSAESHNVRQRKNIPLRGRQYVHIDSVFAWPTLEDGEIHTEGFCHGLSGHFGILSDGTVVPCCLDHSGILALGNAFETPLAAILADPRASRIKQGFACGTLAESLCRRCGFISRFAGKQARKGPNGGRGVR